MNIIRIIKTCENESLLGYSLHNLYIGENRIKKNKGGITIKKILLLVGIILTLTSCQMFEKREVQISWVDFIKLNGITYTADYPHVGRSLTQDDLDKEYDTIQFKVADNIFEPNYKTRDGDAAFLEAGTVVYKVKGYSPSFRVAVYNRGEIRLYEANNNSQAKKGDDYFDIKNKVTYIGFNSEQDGKTELFSIKDKEKVEKLVDMVLQAPVVKNKSINNNSRYFVSFHLNDGTAVTRCYWNEDNYLTPGLQLPDEFKKEVEKAMTE